MSNLLNIAGWLILGLAIAWSICARKKSCGEKREERGELKNADDPGITSHDASWCEAIEALTLQAVIYIDGALKVAAAGPVAARLLGADDPHDMASRHLMDVVPPDWAPAFLDGVALAMRGGAKSWEAMFGTQRVSIKAVARGRGAVLMIREIL